MSARFTILLAFEVLEVVFLWGLWRMLSHLKRVQAELALMVGYATRGLVDRTQELHEVIGELHEHQAPEAGAEVLPVSNTKS